jgi:hypothetical protein
MKPYDVKITIPSEENIPKAMDSFIRNHPETTWFHKQVINGCILHPEQFIPVCFSIWEKRRILGVLSASHIRYDGTISSDSTKSRPLLSIETDDQEEILILLLDALIKWGNSRAAVIEVRNSKKPCNEKKTWLNAGFTFTEHLNLIKPIGTAYSCDFGQKNNSGMNLEKTDNDK